MASIKYNNNISIIHGTFPILYDASCRNFVCIIFIFRGFFRGNRPTAEALMRILHVDIIILYYFHIYMFIQCYSYTRTLCHSDRNRVDVIEMCIQHVVCSIEFVPSIECANNIQVDNNIYYYKLPKIDPKLLDES